MATIEDIPAYKDMMPAVMQAMRELGDSAVNGDINDKVTQILGLPEDTLDIMHLESRQTEIEYRCAWARTYLKKVGYIINTSRGLWILTAKGKEQRFIDPDEIVRKVRLMSAISTTDTNQSEPVSDNAELEPADIVCDVLDWREKLINVLLNIKPSAFEQLTRALLDESGFEDVVVTGRSGDGGIDGYGRVRLQGLLSIPVVFQCKRYSLNHPVGPNDIRDFRGAMQSRADKGLFVTTSRFTKGAREEARRTNINIDLIDGNDLINLLRDLDMGVREVKDYVVDESYFMNF